MNNIYTKYKKLLIFYPIIFFIIYIPLDYHKNDAINTYLKSKTNEYNIFYNSIYFRHKEQALLIFKTLIDQKEIIEIYKSLQNSTKKEKDVLRNKLYEILKHNFENLKFFNIKQLHFHLSNNDSFLRMHQPDKFGDNLNEIRKTICFVNKNNKTIDGFEIGRLYNGYRFVYPIISEDGNHLGSVEVSYIAKTFVENIFNTYGVLPDFLLNENSINKKVFTSEKSNYIKSSYEHFYLSKSILKNSKKIKNQKSNHNEFSNLIKEIALKNMYLKKSISLYDDKINEVDTFIPVVNPITQITEAFIVISSNGEFVSNKYIKFYGELITFNLFLFMIIFFIFREFKSQKEKNLILEENKKLLEIKIKERTSELENGKNQLELKIKEIEKINKKLETYSYTISHDLKEPIRSIRTFSEFIQEDYEDKFDDEAKDYFSRIIRASNRMALMIDDLLLISKIAKQNIKFERIEVSSIIKDVKEILNHKIIERNIQINSTDLPEIFCQPTLIQTVFLNLINNSIKYCDKNEVIIDISSKEFDDYYEFSIKDNGVGIPNEQHYKIFELFRKAHQNKNIEGSGAGLTIVNSVIELHNGKIWVDWSEVNKGTIFKFTIYKNLSNF